MTWYDHHHLSIISASLYEVHWFQPFYTLKNSWMAFIWYVNFIDTSVYRLFWRGWTEKKIFSCFFFLQYYPFKVFSLLSLLCLSSLYYHRNTLTNICVSTKYKHDPFFFLPFPLFSLSHFFSELFKNLSFQTLTTSWSLFRFVWQHVGERDTCSDNLADDDVVVVSLNFSGFSDNKLVKWQHIVQQNNAEHRCGRFAYSALAHSWLSLVVDEIVVCTAARHDMTLWVFTGK